MSEQADEQAELVRLRAEVARLRAAQGTTAATAPAGRRRAALRTVGAVLLITLGCALAPVAVVATWLDRTVTDTDAYVETMTPLIEDPALAQALSRAVTAQVFTALDVEAVAQTALASVAGRTDLSPAFQERITALATPMADGIETFLHSQVESVVGSDTFARVWSDANRAVHAQLVATLTGETREGLDVTDGRVALDLAPFVEVVKDRLVDRGIGVAARIPAIHATFVLFELPDLTRVQGAFAALGTLGAALPVIAAAVLASGVLLARGRRRAVIGAGLGLAAALLVLGAALLIGRGLYLGAVPPELLPRGPAATAFDTVVRFLRTGLRSVFVLGVVVAAAAYLTGPSAAAVALRRGLAAGLRGVRQAIDRPSGLAGPRLGGALATHRRPLRVGAVVVGAFVVLLQDRPTAGGVGVTVLLVLLALAVVELLAAPAAGPADIDDDPDPLTRTGGGHQAGAGPP